MCAGALSCWNQQWHAEGSNNAMNCCTIYRYFSSVIVFFKKKKSYESFPRDGAPNANLKRMQACFLVHVEIRARLCMEIFVH